MTVVAGDRLRTTVSLELLSGAVFEGQIKPLDGVTLQVMYHLDPAPTCGLLPPEVVKQRRTMGLSCGSDVGYIYGRCTIYDLGVSEKVVFSVGPLDAAGQRQLVLQSLARPELGVTVLQLSMDGSALEGGDEHWKPSHTPLVRVKRIVPTVSVLETSHCGVVECQQQVPAKPRAPRGRSGGRRRHRNLATHSTSSSHVPPSESPDLRRAVTVKGDRAVFSEVMQIITSAVRELWIAEGVTSVDDLACLYTTPPKVCHHMDEHNLEDANIDSAVQSWTLAKKWVSCWRRYNIRRQKRTELSPSPAANNQVFKSCCFVKICVNGVPRSSDSPLPTQATTMVKEPEFHPSSPAVLQRLVRVIVEMGPHSSFAVEVSNRSELTMQLFQRRFQHFSDDWLRRVMSALRNWQVWASKHCQLISLASTSSTPTNVAPQWREASGHSWIGSDAKWVEPFPPILRSWHRSGYMRWGTCRLQPMRCHQVFSLRACTIRAKPRVRSQMFGGLVVLLAVACLRWRHQARSVVKHFKRAVHHREVSPGQV